MNDHITMIEAKKLAHFECPDCNQFLLVRGPEGGMSINVACAGCGSEFNFCPLAPLLSHRNGSAGNPDRDRLRTVFGIEL